MKMRDQFDDTPIRPTSNTANEVIRWAPSGVKTFLGGMDNMRDLDTAPTAVLAWLHHKGLTTTGRGSRHGQIILTELGKQVHGGIRRKLEGKS